MQRLIFLLILSCVFSINAQTDQTANVKAAVDTFFEGFHKGDTTLMRSVLADKVVLQTAFRNKEGKDVLRNDGDISNLLSAIANRPAEQKWDEKLLDYIIKIDNNMANAWTPYEFWLNGNFSHCGVNSFQLFRNNGKWEIIYLIDTRRRFNCDPYKED
jgi:hypothetical protein